MVVLILVDYDESSIPQKKPVSLPSLQRERVD